MTAAGVAHVDGRRRSAFIRYQRGEFLVLIRAAIGAEECVDLPLPSAAAASQVARAFDAANFGKRRPCTAYAAIAFAPARGYRRAPGAIAGVQERHREQGGDGDECRGFDTSLARDRLKALAIVIQREPEHRAGVDAPIDQP